MTSPSPLRVMVLHRQRLVAEATAAALQALAPELRVEVTTSQADTLEALPGVNVLLADPALLPDGVIWGSAVASDSALYVALGSPDLADPVTQTVAALRAGGSGWLPAQASPELVLHVVHVVAAGDLWVPLELVGALIHRLIAPPRTAVDDLDLSPRERTVLDLVAAGQTNREIAEQLRLSPNTVRTHRQRLFRKIDAHSAVQAASWLRDARNERPAGPGPRLRSDQP